MYEKLLDTLKIRHRERGGEQWAACPSPHHEGDRFASSWSIHIESGLHLCHGCGFDGNAASLVQTVHDLSSIAGGYVWLREHGFTEKGWLPTEIQVALTRQGDPDMFEFPKTCRFTPFEKWPKPFRTYALKRRLSSDVCERWGIGWAVDGRLKNRLIIPVKNYAGGAAAYHARGLPGVEPKYLAPSEDENPDLDALFGSHEWPPELYREGSVVLCEGSLNAISCASADAHYVAALGGSKTVLSAVQVQELATWERVIIATDNDKSGNAVAATLKAYLRRYTETVRLELPSGKDCNSLDPDKLRNLLAIATSVA